MFRSDAIAYLPLLGTAILATVLFVFLAVIKGRKTAKVSYLTFLALVILISDCVYTVYNPGITNFVLLLLLAAAVLLPYLVMLAFAKPKAEEPKAPLAEEIKKPEIVVEDLKPEEVNLIEKGRSFVAMASDSFGKKDGMQNLLDEINKTFVELTGADGGAVLMVDDFEDSINVKSFTGVFPPPYRLPEDLPHKELRVSTSFKFANFALRDNIFGEIASSGKAEIINSPKNDPRIIENGPEDFLKLGSFIFIPVRLPGRDVVIGLIALSKNPGREFTQEEFDWALTLTGFVESALKTTINFQVYSEKNEISKESKIAENLQNILLPKKLPPLPGISFGSYAVHTEGVCSDSFDVLPVRPDRTSLFLMDVAGKGTNSFLVMSMIRSMIRLLVNTPQPAGTILSLANREICGEVNFEHFASVALINYNAQKKTVQFSSAGTTPVFLYSAQKQTIERKSLASEPLGVEKTTSYKDIQFTVSEGDIIITYTDGLVEALDSAGKQYSLNRLLSIVKTNSKSSGKQIADLVKADMKQFVASEVLHDDQTLLAVKIQ
ncbi:GAF domain-containing SpoIIE family protein phosphatase [Treponema berlinense]|uniref:GAF domain-containing SpoIIE family protein phosphatase n=1 Tax=Treponema berlinense TaxID=225004 RepID=UPI0026EB3B2B|nr:GAF domain-containing SpoIIE family protein phosphatase [Treponema berlinense]